VHANHIYRSLSAQLLALVRRSPSSYHPSVLCLQVVCSDIPNSVSTSGGSCACTQPPFTVSAFNGKALKECLSTSQVGITCPEAYPVEVVSDTAIVTSCLSTDTPCPRGYEPLLGDNPLRQLRCQLKKPACTYDGFNVLMAKSLILTFTSGRRPPMRNLRGRNCASRRGCFNTGLGGNSYKSLKADYAAELVGCVSTASAGCPEGFVAFRSGRNNFTLELCSETPACYAASSNVTVSPTKYGTYTTPALRGDTLVGCLEIAGRACPPEYPKRTTQSGAPACST
jgi:hypothetical protein